MWAPLRSAICSSPWRRGQSNLVAPMTMKAVHLAQGIEPHGTDNLICAFFFKTPAHAIRCPPPVADRAATCQRKTSWPVAGGRNGISERRTGLHPKIFAPFIRGVAAAGGDENDRRWRRAERTLVFGVCAPAKLTAARKMAVRAIGIFTIGSGDRRRDTKPVEISVAGLRADDGRWR